ncbi:hypothetical protein F5148DRAFT_1148376 [Russula earlei]|nr:hypothetical protein F5148DRAFT_1148376 [Russula earlei]
MVPLILILVTLLTRFASHRFFLDFLSGPSPGTRVLPAAGTDRTMHPGHSFYRRQNGGNAMPSSVCSSLSSTSPLVFPTVTAASTSTQGPTQGTPTVPMSPALPTPFPQPFDTTLSNNFTTNSCETFFANMTLSLPFRQCRPFSFLSQTSSQFLEAQSNITALNVDVWGTCNTPVDADQCAANMKWFQSELLVACSAEKSESNQMILQTLASLQTYTLMRDVACLVDQNTSAYCYIEAASSKDPSDLYFYSLPFGIPLPNNTSPSCSSCTKSVMAIFASNVNQTNGLEQTYNDAARLASSKCGSSYVYTQSAIASSSSAALWIGDTATVWTLVFTLCVLFVGLV